MNVLWPRFLKSAYRKEPISSFFLIAGAVDAAIGGVGQHWTLLTFGLTVVFFAIALRWWQIQRTQAVSIEEVPRQFLPPGSSQSPLPMLTSDKRRRHY